MELTNVRALLSAGLAELSKVTVPNGLHNLPLADLDVHAIDIPAITQS